MNLPPESAGGLNIEALGHQGTTLLIGFRSTQIRANALVVAVENPQELVSIEGTRARLGAVTLLPLGGRGIRGMATLPDSTIVLIAGPADDRRDFELFGWRGTGPVVRKLGPVDFGTLHPEALVVRRSGAVYAVSDDGAEFVNGKPCHALSFQEPEASRKQFRVVRLLR